MKKARNAIFVLRVGAVQHSWSRAGWRATVTLLHIVPETARQAYMPTAATRMSGRASGRLRTIPIPTHISRRRRCGRG